jgi:acetoin utilization protein AcuC
VPGQVELVYGDSYLKYRHSDEHPLQPVRVQLTFELIQRLGLLDHARLRPPRQATDAEITLVHSPDYVELVHRLSDPAWAWAVTPEELSAGNFDSPDNPVFDGMHEATAEIVGGSLVAAEAVHQGRAAHAFNPAGGLHHAMRDRASGFCVYNDAAVAIAWLRKQGHRVAYVDVDVHHGDGTEALFMSDPDVITISLHESTRYLFPWQGGEATDDGHGLAQAVNLPLLPFAWDEPWLAAFEAVVPEMVRRFQPTVLVTQDGCDSHFLDPLAHLQTSTAIWPPVGQRFHQLAHEVCEGRWVATGGGGYAVREVVPRAWSLLFAEMVEQPELARELVDPEPFVPGPTAAARVWAALEADLTRLGAVHSVELLLQRAQPT